MESFKAKISQKLSEVLGTQVLPNELGTPPDRAMGDFAFPCFKLAKAERKAPPVLAAELTEKLKPLFASDETLTVQAVGPYVNFTLTHATIAGDLLVEALTGGKQYASLPKNSREKWVFEYSSPNVAKPFQIYHLRTTIVGSALSKIARHRGFDVTTINHLGDWGTQYGKLAVAVKRYANELPAELTLKDLVNVYVRIHKDMETDPSIEKEGQANFLRLEDGDPELRALWKKFVDISVSEFKKTYARYQVEFDHYWGESHYEDQLKPLLADLTKRGLLVEDQGAKIVRVTSRDGKELPPCLLQKSDGASIYATRDVAAAIYRYEKFHFARMSYVVGKEQTLHFEQVFGVLRAMVFAWEKACEHIATGLYRFKDAKMSTRKGNFITLEEVNELCTAKALALMNERNQPAGAAVTAAAGDAKGDAKTGNAKSDTVKDAAKDSAKVEVVRAEQKLTEAEIAVIADQVAIGALVFADLSTDPTRDLEFDVDRVISFEGETGPYLQYAHTRCLSILRKAQVDSDSAMAATRATDAKILKAQIQKTEELNLIRTLARFGETLDRTLDQRKPSQLTTYLIDLTRDFGVFYRECKVVNADDAELTRARVALVLATQNVMSLGLDLLGMPKPEKM